MDKMNNRDVNLLHKFKSAFAEKDWNELLNLLNPKMFKPFDSKELVPLPILAKIAQILTTENSDVPNSVKIACLKCLGNSCFNNYMHKEYVLTNIEKGTYSHELYSSLANNENLEEMRSFNPYPFDSYFPYEGVIEWTLRFIITSKTDKDLLNEKLEILRLSIQFLCNLFTFAFKDNNYPDQCDIPQYLYDSNLKDIIIAMTHSEHVPIVRASCAFIHNALKEFEGETFLEEEMKLLCSQLLRPSKEGFESAKEALMLLLCEKDMLQCTYSNMTNENKLCLLEIIYNELSDITYKSENEHMFTKETIEFLIERFCRRSDLILKTVDMCLDEIESTEIIILLDILGVITSRSCEEFSSLKGHKSLLINCIYLLQSIQIIGKQSDNYFTPLQKLSDVASAIQGIRNSDSKPCSSSDENKLNTTMTDLQNHPTFGFKAGLIRIIGNMCYRNKECQDLLRETNAVPLLLDCCNIDARNPLIMQWTILALRNLCEDNPANQEIIRNCSRVGVVESSVLREMGVTLHEDEDGKKIGIVPLPGERK
ncbi:ataxin-10 isoform X2 [Frieseomelitta varia]|uniref:ataxin-10 isoform X2 n=1 Tax=Frieseomelitta varia TaxID=561572 RepID=UPI001CB68448|nr:ataxin-10 isoform X2 [Frieseomelitta varia]